MVRVRCRNLFLRKHRRRPYKTKTKWHQTFTQKQAMAMQSFKQLVAVAQQIHDPSPSSHLLRSFSLYHLHPTPQAYHFLIKTLLRNLHFHHIPSLLHHLELIDKIPTPEYIFVDLIKAFGNANRIQDAVNIFYSIPKFRCVPSAYSLNSLLALLCRDQYGLRLVPQVLSNSLVMNIRVQESTLTILVSALCRMNKVGYAIEILQRMIDDGLAVNHQVCSFILSSICAQGDLDGEDIIAFLRELKRLGFYPAMGDYNRVIRFLVKKGRGLDAWDVLNQMKSDGFKPGIVSYNMLLKGLIAGGDYMLADDLFDELLIFGLVPDVYTYNAYIYALCKQNKIEQGIKMVACMEELQCKPNVLTYNMFLDVMCKVGEISSARTLVREMEFKGTEMNFASYRIIIDGLVSKGEILEAGGLMKEALHKCFCHQSSTFDQVICGLCQRGLVCEALELLRNMVDKNVSPGAKVWEALLLSSETKLKIDKPTLIDLVKSTLNNLVK